MTTVDTPELPATTVPDGNMTVLPSITVTTLNNSRLDSTSFQLYHYSVDTDSGEQTAIILVTTFTCLIIVIIIVALTVLLYMRISKKTGIYFLLNFFIITLLRNYCSQRKGTMFNS